MPRNDMLHKAKSAFTFVELAVVLAIAAVILSLAIGSGMSVIEAERLNTTHERMKFILYALDKYVRTYDHLPCPADPTLAFGDTYFGIGQGSDTDNGNCNASNLLSDAATNVKAGSVPVITLGLAPVVGEDGWGRRIIYAVDQDITFLDRDATATAGYTRHSTSCINNVNITVKNSAGTTVTSQAAVILISAGPNGHGAWKGKGGATRLNVSSPSSTEEDNSHYSTAFDSEFFDVYPSSSFDDIVYYKNKWQLAQ